MEMIEEMMKEMIEKTMKTMIERKMGKKWGRNGEEMGKKWGRKVDHCIFHEPDFVDPTRMIIPFSVRDFSVDSTVPWDTDIFRDTSLIVVNSPLRIMFNKYISRDVSSVSSMSGTCGMLPVNSTSRPFCLTVKVGAGIPRQGALV